MKKTIGIIGGTGQMGQFFKKFFEKNNCKVKIASRRTKLTIEECAAKSDVVIISVPISKTLKIIKKIAPKLRKGCLLMDLTSIKTQPVRAMLRYSRNDVEVIGTHPVFGPSVSSIKNQTMVLCPARGKEWFRWLKKMLEKNKANIIVSSPEKHDKMMSIIQGMVHFSTIVAAHSIKKSNIDIKESLRFTSPIYKIRMDMIGRILNQDPKLYADIEIMNSYTLKAIDEYIKSAKLLRKIIKRKDIKKFVDYFSESANFMGDFKKEASKDSDYLIGQMVKRC